MLHQVIFKQTVFVRAEALVQNGLPFIRALISEVLDEVRNNLLILFWLISTNIDIGSGQSSSQELVQDHVFFFFTLMCVLHTMLQHFLEMIWKKYKYELL